MLSDNFARQTPINQSEFSNVSLPLALFLLQLLTTINSLSLWFLLQLVKFAGGNTMVATYVRFIAGGGYRSVRDRERRATSISPLQRRLGPDASNRRAGANTA